MMGERRVGQEALFYEFSLEGHVPETHLLRSIDRFVDLDGLRQALAPYYGEKGRPSIDPELLIRMLIVGYCFGIRSERRVGGGVHLDLALRCVCRLAGGAEGWAGGEGSAVDASMIKADANRQRSVPGSEWLTPETASHAVREYLAVLDDAAFGAATPVVPKFISHADPASRWTGANGGLAFFAYCTNYLIDLKCAVILDVEATTAVRQAEVTTQRRMIDRTQERFGLWPGRLAADTRYGSAENLAWLVHERGIEPHIPVFDKSKRTDGTFSRDDFAYDRERDCYICPAGKELRQRQKIYRMPRPLIEEEGMMRYRASKLDCECCSLKPQCCPNAPARKNPRSIHEGARDMARDIAAPDAYVTSRRERKKIEMLFAHLKRILKLDRLRLRGPNGARDEFHLAATVQNLRKLAMLIPVPAPSSVA